MIIDLGITVGIPALVMVLFYFVQGHRFNIFEQIGCFPATFNTTLAYPLVWMWPLLLGVISMVYSGMTIASFLKRRREMSQFLSPYHHPPPVQDLACTIRFVFTQGEAS